MSDLKKTREPAQVTNGAGIAIAGVWLAGAAVTIVLFLSTFVWNHHLDQTSQKSSDGTSALAFVIVLFLIALPMIAAYSITKVILGRDD